MCFNLFLLSQVCKNYTRAYIHCLVTKDAMGSQLLSYHNLYYMMQVLIQSCDEKFSYEFFMVVFICMIEVNVLLKVAA